MRWPWSEQLDRMEGRQGLILDTLYTLIRRTRHMADDLKALQDSYAQLQNDVDTLLKAWGAVTTGAATAADLDALKALIDAEDVKVQAALPTTPPTP